MACYCCQAVQKNVKLMVDAEHTYFQPAIDHLTLYLMRKYNVGGKAYIYNTYQVRVGSARRLKACSALGNDGMGACVPRWQDRHMRQ